MTLSKSAETYLDSRHSESQIIRVLFPDQVNYAEEVDEDIPAVMQKFKEQKILSELIVPILYTSQFDEKFVLATSLFKVKTKEFP